MSRGIGDIISKLRGEAGYTQEQLSSGLCLGSTLARIEANALIPDQFILDRLFGHLGKSTERLEYILPIEVYEVYELRYRIQSAVLYQKFEEAEELLQQYEEKKFAEKELHRQFIEQERAQIAWIQEKGTDVVLEHINCAIRQTITSEEALSVEELKLLLFRWEICHGTKYERQPKEVLDIWNYMEERRFEPIEKTRIYPYILLLFKEYFQERIGKRYLKEQSWNVLEIMRDEGVILYMPEILEANADILDEVNGDAALVKELREMRETLLEVEEEYGVHYEKYRLFQRINRSFQLDCEVIRKCRLASKMSQEELCDGICSVETLSRIERGVCHPSNKNLKKLLEKMNRNGERFQMAIMTEQYEMIGLEKQIAKTLHRKDYKTLDGLIEKIEKKLDMSFVENRQYLLTEQLRNKLRKGSLSFEESIEQLYNLLKMTLKAENENLFAYYFTQREENILNQIGILYYEIDKKDTAINLWEKIIANYEKSKVDIVFKILSWELITGNLAGKLEELNYADKPIQICQKRLKKALEIGKGNEIGRSLAIIACILERKHDTACAARFRQTLNMYKLTKMEYRYKCVKEYVKEKEINLEED